MAAILSGFLVYLMLLMFKNQNTYRQREKIIDAVYAYNLQCIKEHRFSELISYDCMRDYNSSLLDIFDWGCRNILPECEYRLIKPFIRK